MSALIVKGKIVGAVEKDIKPRKDGKQFEPFKVINYYVVNGGDSAPLRITGSGEEIKYKIDEQVEIPVWIKQSVDYERKRSYTEIREVKE